MAFTAFNPLIAQSHSCPVQNLESTDSSPRTPLEYSWSPPIQTAANSFGAVHIRTAPPVQREFDLQITALPVSDPLQFQTFSCKTEASIVSYVLGFQSGGRSVTVNLSITPRLSDSFAIDITSTDISVQSVSLSNWPPYLLPQAVNVPYYSAPVTWLSSAGLFANIYWDWTSSNATQLSNLSASYQPLTSGLRNSLKERLVLKLSPNFVDVLPDIPNPPSPFLPTVSGRTVLDIWGPAFSTVAATLPNLQNAGLRNCVVLIHVWQQSGYDNGLPGHYPANAAFGGDSGLTSAIQSGKNAGCLVGLHENYVDYYPDYTQFNPLAIALSSNSQRQNAWYNPGVPIQSFGTRPTLYVSIGIISVAGNPPPLPNQRILYRCQLLDRSLLPGRHGLVRTWSGHAFYL